MKKYISILPFLLLLFSVTINAQTSKTDTTFLPEVKATILLNSNSDKINFESSQISPNSNPLISSKMKSVRAYASSLNIGNTVGAIPIQKGINTVGAMTVNVPIDVVSGIAAIQPNLAIAYNSLGGNGLLGYGWELSGISCIARKGYDVFHNGKTTPISITGDLTLDGKRLIKDNNYLKQIGERSWITKYYLESSNKSCVVYAYGSGPQYYTIYSFYKFEVIYPDGKKAEYERSYNNLSWFITKISDANGNCMNYNYAVIDNHPYISSISYGGNSAKKTAHFETINFNYEARRDSSKVFNMGNAIIESRRLTQLSTSKGIYKFSYSNDFYSLLDSISYKSDGKQLKPLPFNYGNGSSSTQMSRITGNLKSYFTEGNRETINACTGIYDIYSGEEGLVLYPKKNAYVWGKYKDFPYNAYHSEYSADDVILIKSVFDDISPANIIKVGDGFRELLTMNIDQLPKTEEIVKINLNGSFNGTQNLSFSILTPNAYGGWFNRTKSFIFPAAFRYNNTYYSAYPMSFLSGDFNGDGIEEVCAIRQKENAMGLNYNSGVYLFNLKSESSGLDSYSFYETPFNIEMEDRVIPGDYDGDGKPELYHFTETGIDVYSFVPSPTASAPLAFTLQKIATTNAINRGDFDWEERERTGNIFSARWYAKHTVLLGDINGDGKMDIIRTPAYGTKKGNKQIMHDPLWIQCLSTGSGTFEISKYTPAGWIDTYKDTFMHDFNGDGRSDLISLKDNNVQIWLSDGHKINSTMQASYPLGDLATDGKFLTVGLQQSNHNRILAHIKDGKFTRLLVPNNEKVNAFLTSIQDSYGVKTAISYSRIDGIPEFNTEYDNSVYTAGYGAKFPFENYNGYFWVANNIKSFDTNSGKTYENTSYSYQNAIIHRQGLGLCGFESIIAKDNISEKSNSTIYDPFNFNILKQQSNDKGKVENDYSVTITSDKEPIIRLLKQTNSDILTGNVSTSENKYDEFGNITENTKNYGNILTETTTTNYTNILSDSINLIGLPNSTKVQKVRGSDTFKTSREITYSDAHLPITVVDKKNDQLALTTEFEYDQWSNITKRTEKAYSSKDKLSTSYQYNNNGRFLTSLTDSREHTTNYSYNAKGLLEKETDYKGNVTQYSYDSFGRKSLTINPDKTQESITYNWVNNANFLFSISKEETGKPRSVTYYDAVERECRNSFFNFSGKEIKTDKTYDERGRISKVSLPFSGTSASLWNTYTYDDYDRITSLAYASGKSTTYSYSGNDVTETENGIITTKKYDASGSLISVTDEAGTITYNLRPDKQPKDITAPGNIVTSFDYDNYGRRTSITDPSAGKKSETYDDDGNISSSTDANGKVTTMTYDKYGNIKSKIRPEFSTEYKYNNDGLITSAQSTNGTSSFYEYDLLNRPLTEKENVLDSIWFQKSYNYADGNVSSIVYTSQNGNIGSEDYTYTNGTLTEVKLNNNTSIWRLNEENDLSQPLSVTTGALNRTYTYDQYGLSTGRATENIQNASYTFDPLKGNLLSRKDNLRGIQESFTYDNLNRLTGFGDKTTTYDEKGNILSMSGVGNMEYTLSEKPYAVSGIDVAGNSVPLRSQKVTYASFMRPLTIEEDGYKASFDYNADGSRVKTKITKDNGYNLTGYLIDNKYEISDELNVGSAEYFYLAGDVYSAPAVYIKDKKTDGQWHLYYICRDYLGSITHITDANGALVQELSYDAWGRLRNPADQKVYEPGKEPKLFLGRGYTGHEHLSPFGLINMNARLYDPALGRFLSPDPYVQAPDFSQNFNRYSYGLNNPLIYTDQNGEFINLIIGAAVGGVFNWAMHGFQFNAKGLAYFGVGALSGALGAGIAGGITAAFTPGVSFGAGFMGTQAAMNTISASYASSLISGAAIGAGSGASGGFISGLGNGLVEGDNIGQSLLGGLRDGAIGGITGGVIGGATGGTKAALEKRNILNGDPILEKPSLTNLPNIDRADFQGRLSPYMKGQQGVNRAIENFKAEGGTVLGTEVTIEVDGVRIKLDFVGDIDGERVLAEVKNGLKAGFTKNQKIVFPKLLEHPAFIPRGLNAIRAGFKPNVPFTDNYKVTIIKYY